MFGKLLLAGSDGDAQLDPSYFSLSWLTMFSCALYVASSRIFAISLVVTDLDLDEPSAASSNSASPNEEGGQNYEIE